VDESLEINIGKSCIPNTIAIADCGKINKNLLIIAT